MKVTISDSVDKVFDVTDEQLEKIKKILKAKKGFKPIEIHRGCFVVGVDEGHVKITTGRVYRVGGCCQNSEAARQFIAAIESAIDYIEK